MSKEDNSPRHRDVAGNYIYKARIKRGLTQKQVAENGGSSERSVRRVERNALGLRADLVLKVTVGLGMNEEEMEVFYGIVQEENDRKRLMY